MCANEKKLTFDALALVVNKRLLRNSSDHLRSRATDHVPNLVCDTRETRAERRWGQLVQMNGDDTPRALDHKLKEERTSGEAGLRVGEDPGGDDARCEDAGDDDGATTAKGLGDVADDRATDGCAGFGDDRAAGGCLLCESLAGLSGTVGLVGLSGMC